MFHVKPFANKCSYVIIKPQTSEPWFKIFKITQPPDLKLCSYYYKNDIIK